MITNNVYTYYQTMDSREEIETFVNEGTPISSNFENWREMIGHLCDYRDSIKRNYTKKRDSGSTYHNVYAHFLKILIPYEVQQSEWSDFVKIYMETIDARYKKLLWVCKFSTINKANYAEIACFTRYVYAKPRKRNQVFHRDYYYNSETGKICCSNHPNAVLKAKKGQEKRKDDGSPITETVYVKEHEERMFKYRNFVNFTQKLKCKYLKAVEKMCGCTSRHKCISRVTILNDDTTVIRKSKMFKNSKIREVNDILIQFQDGINNGGFYAIDDIYKKFHKLLDDVDEMIHRTQIEFKKIKNYIQNWWITNIAEEFILE